MSRILKNKRAWRHITCFLALLVGAMDLSAQHYLYIQSEQNQLFYVRKGSETFSSSASGFVILSRLKDSTYELVIGFPRDQFPPHRFRGFRVRGDRGVLLKQYDGKAWGLMDLKTNEVTMGEAVEVKAPQVEKPPPPITTDSFTTILASAIGDPGLMATELVTKELNEPVTSKREPVTKPEKQEQKVNVNAVPEVAGPVAKGVTASSVDAGSAKGTTELKSKQTGQVGGNPNALQGKPVAGVTGEPGVQKSVALIRNMGQEKTALGYQILFMDQSADGRIDTIDVQIDYPKSPAQVDIRREEKKGVDGNLASTAPAPTGIKVPGPASAQDPAVKTVAGAPAQRSDCARQAGEKDLTALKRKMLTAPDTDAMVAVAQKEFRARCYTTDQVRQLVFLFTKDEGRYRLMDVAYPFVQDPGAFPALETLLTDDYYIRRFRAFLR